MEGSYKLKCMTEHWLASKMILDTWVSYWHLDKLVTNAYSTLNNTHDCNQHLNDPNQHLNDCNQHLKMQLTSEIVETTFGFPK